ncbi:MAG: 16S rRNA (adenine(1518)-N(6)/adenine(1519)-N(6))-dimethyltransferase RsmA [Chloroflexi bacterium]|nr:16S rRNA (adenine(1518)-N(6)/adenine(1519)-N(6))-dimethyltransferase RsmA [Chloroflexota bacterium]
MPPLNVAALLRQYDLTPKKGLGQNFLVDPSALQQVVEVAEISSQDTVLEVGAGLGSLTRFLAQAARQVVAVELDNRLIPILEQVLAPFNNVTLYQGDILAMDPAELAGQPGYLVAANIPYYITSAVIRHLLETKLKPRRMVLTVQKEVAARICAAPGDLSLLALSVQVYGKPYPEARIPAGAFYPAPKVDSSVVRIDLYPESFIPAERLESFFRLAKAGFGQKRKTLRNALSAGLGWPPQRAAALLESAAIDPQRRAETLALSEWARLVEGYSGLNPANG